MILTTIILAAGKGTRMKSAKPKVLQTLAGQPLLGHVLATAQQVGSHKNIVVYGFEGEQVKSAFATDVHRDIAWVEQAEQLGTGHAVKVTLSELPADGKSLILYGDVPLIQLDTLNQLIAANRHGMAMLTLEVANPFGLGRIVRDSDGKVQAIVEQKDADETQQSIREINSGIYCVDNQLLHRYLPQLSNDNAQGEYYLTDIVKMAVADGIEIATISPTFDFEIEGVNDRLQLANLERTWQGHLIQQLQIHGVQFADPSRVDIRGRLTAGRDVFIDVNVVIEGQVHLGDNVVIDAGCIISDSTIGNACHIKPYCVITESQIGHGADIGPFAHLRPHTDLGDLTKIGNFVEIKKSTVGKGSKINHLSYVGDAQIGQDVNVGAGTITCNYDGVNKFKTVVDDGAFIGSNSSLVAPVTIGQNATIGAGSVITKDAPQNKLVVARGKQVTIDHWQRPEKK